MSLHVLFATKILKQCYCDVPMNFSIQKLTERKAALPKLQFSDEKAREKWLSVLNMEFMSSEESAAEEDEEVIIVHPLPWRSARFDTILRSLDDLIHKEKSPQARRQTKKRVVGLASFRPKPISKEIPSWAFAAV